MSDSADKKRTTQEELLTEIIKMHATIDDLKKELEEKLSTFDETNKKVKEMYDRHERLYNA